MRKHLDVLLQCYFRAKKAALPTEKRLAWLQHRASEERAEWVTRYRDVKLIGQLQCQQAFEQLGLEALGISVCLRMEKQLPLQEVSARHS